MTPVNFRGDYIFRFALMGIVFLGAVAPAATSIFFFSDPMMGILAIVNLLALLMLFPIAKRLIVDFAEQLKAGIDRPVLDSDKYSDLEIDHSAWSGNQLPVKDGE
jgi:AGCS family alanine or glycine:cation symporter